MAKRKPVDERLNRFGLTEKQIRLAKRVIEDMEPDEILSELEKGIELGLLVFSRSLADDLPKACFSLPGWPKCECPFCSGAQSPKGCPGCDNPAVCHNEADDPLCEECYGVVETSDDEWFCQKQTHGLTRCHECGRKIVWVGEHGTCDCGEAWSFESDNRFAKYEGNLVEEARDALDEAGLEYDTPASLKRACAWLKRRGVSKKTVERLASQV